MSYFVRMKAHRFFSRTAVFLFALVLAVLAQIASTAAREEVRGTEADAPPAVSTEPYSPRVGRVAQAKLGLRRLGVRSLALSGFPRTSRDGNDGQAPSRVVHGLEEVSPAGYGDPNARTEWRGFGEAVEFLGLLAVGMAILSGFMLYLDLTGP